jgi:hypothetical protein
VAALAATMAIAGCATRTASPTAPREYLDERTAATITVAGRAWVFACDRTDLGVHARDYVTLTSVDVNTSGTHAAYVLGYAWSTLDKRRIEGDDPGSHELVADDRTLPLATMPDGFTALGLHDPPLPAPSQGALPLAAPASPETLRFLLESANLRVVRTRSGVLERCALWRVEPDR